MADITTRSGQRFASEPADTLLDAAARSGVHFPYSCRTGRCSTCKARVLGGTSIATVDELGLTAAERADGWILTCVRCATSDLTLDIEDLGTLVVPPALTLPARLQSLERIGDDLLKVFLRLPPNSPFRFLPGQYLQVIGPGGLRRSYSLANGGAGLLELHIRAVPGGAMSAWWFEVARANDLVRVQGPLGTFFLRDCASQHLVFLATGTGIAPVKAMLEDLAARPAGAGQPRSVQVYWGGRTRRDLYWDLAASHPGVDFVPVLSREGADWAGAHGYVQQAACAKPQDWSRTWVYACGSDAMIHDARATLLAAGLPDHRFLADAFVCSA